MPGGLGTAMCLYPFSSVHDVENFLPSSSRVPGRVWGLLATIPVPRPGTSLEIARYNPGPASRDEFGDCSLLRLARDNNLFCPNR